MLEVKNLSVSIHDMPILDRLDLTVEPGKVAAIMGPDERAAKGVFLAFQYPVEIPGVATMTFLKAALNAQRRARGEADLTTPDFMRAVRGAAQNLKIDPEM